MDLVPHCDSIRENGLALAKTLKLFMQLKLYLNWPNILRYWPRFLHMLPAACVISMHYFVRTHCGLGCDTEVLLPARSLPEPVTARFDNSEENKLTPVINSVIRIFFSE
jgi:hypothetical protein